MALAGLAFAATSLAQLTKYKDWDKAPEAYFMTSQERADWKKVATDQDAEVFIATYYAKRGGEAFKQEVARRVAAADQQFKGRRQKGSESARGRIFIVLGAPTRVLNSQPGAADGGATPDTGLGAPGTTGDVGGAREQTWLYDRAKFDPSWGIGEVRARIAVNTQVGSDDLQNKSEVDRAISIVADKSIVNPNATVNPAAAAAAAAAPAVQAPSAAAAGAPATGGTAAAKPATGAAPAAGAPATGGAATAPPPPPAPAAIVPLPDAVKTA